MGVSQLCLLLCKPQKLVVIRCYKYQKNIVNLELCSHTQPHCLWFSHIFPCFPCFPCFPICSHGFPVKTNDFPRSSSHPRALIPGAPLKSRKAGRQTQPEGEAWDVPVIARGSHQGLVNFPLSFYSEVSGNWCTSQSSRFKPFCIYTHSLGYPHSRKPLFKAWRL